jgi:hypothetical protein
MYNRSAWKLSEDFLSGEIVVGLWEYPSTSGVSHTAGTKIINAKGIGA